MTHVHWRMKESLMIRYWTEHYLASCYSIYATESDCLKVNHWIILPSSSQALQRIINTMYNCQSHCSTASSSLLVFNTWHSWQSDISVTWNTENIELNVQSSLGEFWIIQKVIKAVTSAKLNISLVFLHACESTQK